jgi:hypothetical protein
MTEDMLKIINNAEVRTILEQKNHLQLAKYIGRTVCGFTDTDEKYIDLFWDTAFNKSWLYLSEDMARDHMGYRAGKNMMLRIYDKLHNEYENQADYKIVSLNHDLVQKYYSLNLGIKKDPRGGALKKYYIITGETYKALLASAQTAQGKVMRKYFIKIEFLANYTTKVIFEHMQNIVKTKLVASEQQIAKLETKQLRLESFVRNIQALERNQRFYLATTENYARQHRYEYGGVKDPKDLANRLNTYNTGRAEGDLYYFVKVFKCNDYRVIEQNIGSILQQLKDKSGGKKEMVTLYYPNLEEVTDFVCEHHDKGLEFINARCQEFLKNTIDLDGVVPPPIDVNDYMEIIVTRNGKTRSQKVDVSGWTDTEIDAVIEDIINQCAHKSKGIPYEFARHKDSVALELTWGLLTPYFDVYRGLSKTDWRSTFKRWFVQQTPRQLRVKGIKVVV